MRLRINSLFSDILVTFFTQVAQVLAIIFVYRLIALNFGPTQLGEYSLVRRIVSFLSPLFLLGMGVSLPRWIAFKEKNKEKQVNYFVVGMCIVLLFCGIVLGVMNIFDNWSSKILFGTQNYKELIPPFSILSLGVIFHSLVYSYLRGKLLVKGFNALQLVNMVLVPIGVIFFLKNQTIYEIITLIGELNIIVACSFILFFVRDFQLQRGQQSTLICLKELTRYGLPRVPGDFALAGILSLGPVIGVHLLSMERVGFLTIGQNLLGGVGAGLTPLGLILLPRVSRLVGKGKQQPIMKGLELFIPAIIQLALFVTFQLFIFMDLLIKDWLGTEFSEAIPILRIIAVGIFFYAFYIALRSIIDAAKVEPINARNIFASLGIFIVSLIIFLKLPGIQTLFSFALALVLSLACLGILTYVSVDRIFDVDTQSNLKAFGIGIIINVILGSMALIVRHINPNLYWVILFEVFLGFVYIALLYILRTKWLKYLLKNFKRA